MKEALVYAGLKSIERLASVVAAYQRGRLSDAEYIAQWTRVVGSIEAVAARAAGEADGAATS